MLIILIFFNIFQVFWTSAHIVWDCEVASVPALP